MGLSFDDRVVGPIAERAAQQRRDMALLQSAKGATTLAPYAARVGQFRYSSVTGQRGRARSSLLRRFADRCEPVRTAINRRKQQVAMSRWHVVRTDDPKRPPNPKVVAAVTKLLRYVNDAGLSFSELIHMVMEDRLVLDAGCFELELTLGGKSKRTGCAIHALWPVDGASIEVDPAWETPKDRGGYGCDPDKPRYHQRDPMTGKLEADLRNDQLCYIMQNPTTHRILGFSEVEMVIATIERALYGETYAFELIQNPVPPGLLAVPGLTGDPLDSFREYFNNELEPGEVPIVGTPEGTVGKLEYARTAWSPNDLMFDKYREWLVNIIAFVFQIDRTIFGLTADINRSTSQTMSDRTDEGYLAIALHVAACITRDVIVPIDADHAFEFQDLTATDPLVQASIDKIYLSYGVLLPNEKRADLDYDPYEGGDVPIRPAGAPALPGAQAPPTTPPPAPEPAPGEEPKPNEPPKALGTLILRSGQAMRRFSAHPSPSNLAAWEKAEAELEAAERIVPFQRSGNGEREDALRTKLHDLIADERAHLSGVWDRYAAEVRRTASRLLHNASVQVDATRFPDKWEANYGAFVASLSGAKAFTGDDFRAPLSGLARDLVSRKTYAKAVNHGRSAAGAHRDNADPAIDVWVNHVQQYADAVPDRLAGEIADVANAAQAEADSTVQSVLDRIDSKLEALRSSVTSYADPPWGAGQNGYGAQLQDQNILMDWVLDDGAEHCDDCPSLADGSPYSDLPTWPAMGETQCRANCRCEIRANEQSWNDSLGGDAAA